MTQVKKIIKLLRHGESLKTTDREGWKLAGVDSDKIESVAEHSFGSVLSSIVIGQYLRSTGTEIDMEKVVLMGALHDLPESITGDIARTEKFVKNEELVKAKEKAEKDAIRRILEPLGDSFRNLHDIWNEFNLGESIESRVVRGADIIDMLLHARELEDTGTSSQSLDQFFKSSKAQIEALSIEIITEIFNTLYSEHKMRI